MSPFRRKPILRACCDTRHPAQFAAQCRRTARRYRSEARRMVELDAHYAREAARVLERLAVEALACPDACAA